MQRQMPKGYHPDGTQTAPPAQYPHVLKFRCGDDTLRQLEAIRERTGERGRSEVLRRLVAEEEKTTSK